VNVIIHQDESGSMNDLIQFYGNGTFIGSLQDALLSNKIGDDLERYPNIYAYFGVYSRNPSTGFSITNPNGSLTINQAFMRGESSGSATIAKWTGLNYFSNGSSHVVNICTNVMGSITGGRLTGYGNEIGGGSPKSEDVHGSLWSIWTTPNAISTGIAGRYGSVIGSNVRAGSTTIIITNSDEQGASPAPMINQLLSVSSDGSKQRTINGPTGEMIFRKYRVIALSSYTGMSDYDGVLFYGSSSTQPFGYVRFLSDTEYEIDRSNISPLLGSTITTTTMTVTRNRRVGVTPTTTTVTTPTVTTAISSPQQLHDTITLASETRGGLFKIRNIFGTIDRRIAFSRCLAEFIADTV
jgi:hypothetical protein